MVRTAANRMKEILGLDTEPVAVFLLPSGADNSAFDGFVEVAGHRYCQLLMRARHGESLRLSPDGLACPAAASAFGFKPENRHFRFQNFSNPMSAPKPLSVTW